jgi:hypothetical protein
MPYLALCKHCNTGSESFSHIPEGQNLTDITKYPGRISKHIPGRYPMSVDKQLVQNADSTVRMSEDVGNKTLYLSFNSGNDAHGDVRHTETHIKEVRLPKSASHVRLHGPGEFDKPEGGKVYGVQITFRGGSKEAEKSITIEIPHPVKNVQLLDRKPDERYKAVA